MFLWREEMHISFVFRVPKHGPWVIKCLKEHMEASWYQGKLVRVQISGVIYQFHEVTAPSDLRYVSKAGVSDLLNDKELYTGIEVPEECLHLFTLLPNEWQ